MKKILSIICIIALALSMTGTVWAEEDFSLPETPEEDYGIAPASVNDPSTWIPYEVTGGNIYFDPETQNIVGCDSSVTEAVIPAEIDGKAVRMIVSMKPTSGTSRLQKVVISEGISGIAGGAFYNLGKLTDIQIPDSVTEIGSAAFEYCSVLVNVNLPPKLTIISQQLFSDCSSITEINIPSGVKTIGNFAFQNCTSLEKVNIPDGVTNIGSYAFSGCRSLKTLYIPDSVSSIGYDALAGLESLESISVGENNPKYYSRDGVLFTKKLDYYDSYGFESLILYPMSKPDEIYTVPPLTIGNNGQRVGTAFRGNPYLKVLKFSSGESTRFGTIDSQIYELINLKEVHFPINTGIIDPGAFNGCYAITDVYYDGCAERWEKIKNSAGGNNGSLFAATVHFNENDHIIQGVELEVGENTSVAKFESESGKSYQYNTYYHSKPFSLMENSALVAMLDGNDLTVKVSMPGWDHIIYEFSRYNTVSTNTAEYTLEDVVPQSGETHIEVDLDILGSTAYLGDIYIDSYGNLRTKLGTGTNTYTVSGTGFPVDLPVHFGSADLVNAYGGELSDYEVEVYYVSNGEKVVVGRERMSAATPHEHIFGDEWKNDAQNHWHVCKKCSQTSAPEPHTLVNGVCAACGYVQPEHVHHFTCVGAEGVHWDQCDECGYTTNVRAHSIVDGRCSECGYSPAKTYDANGDGEVTLDDAIIVLKAAMKVLE